MENVVRLDTYRRTTPIAAIDWVNDNQKHEIPRRAEIQYRRTKSTIAIDASELRGMQDDKRIDAFVNLIKVCGYFGREEVVVECIEDLRELESIRTYADCFSALQSDVVKACRSLGIGPLRVALEKRHRHFDLRIYPENTD